jgi:hypothetical protein
VKKDEEQVGSGKENWSPQEASDKESSDQSLTSDESSKPQQRQPPSKSAMPEKNKQGNPPAISSPGVSKKSHEATSSPAPEAEPQSEPHTAPRSPTRMDGGFGDGH